MLGGTDEQRYQAAAAARCLGAEVYAEGDNDALVWVFRMPSETSAGGD